MRHPHPNVEQILQLPLTHETTVSSEWLDVMGHMNVAYYTAMFSSAMRGFRTSLGLGNEEIQRQQLGTFAIETHTRYLRESLMGDHLSVYTRVFARSKSRKRFHAMHFAVNSRGDDTAFLAATFESVVALVDLKARHMRAMPPEFLKAVDEKITEQKALTWVAPVCGAISVA